MYGTLDFLCVTKSHAGCELVVYYFTGYGRLPEKSVAKMTREDWDRKAALCNDLLRVYDLTEGALAIVKGA